MGKIYCTECGYEVGYVDNKPKEIEKMIEMNYLKIM